ncbi:MAG: hypothetical protein AB4040_00810 [Synechococcus sp.]
MLKFLPYLIFSLLFSVTSLPPLFAQEGGDESAIEASETVDSGVSPEDSDTPPSPENSESEDTEAEAEKSEEDVPKEAEAEEAGSEESESEESESEEAESEEAEVETGEADTEEAATTGLLTIGTFPLQSATDRFDIMERDGRQLAVLGLQQEQSVAILDLESGEILAQTAIGFEPNTVRYDSINDVVYAAGIDSEGLVVLEARDLAIRKGYGLGAGVLDIDFDGETGRIFATHPSISSVSVMQLSEEQARTLPLPRPPLAIVYNSVSRNVLITTRSDDSLGVLVVNSENGEVLALLRSGVNPEDIDLNLATQRAVVLNSGSTDLTAFVRKADIETIQTIGLNWRPTRIALSSDGQRAYVTSRDSNHLQVANLETGELEAVYDLEDAPLGIHYLPSKEGPAVLVSEAGEPQLRWLQLPEIQPGQMAAVIPRLDKGSAAGRVVDLAGNAVEDGVIRLKSIGRITPDLQLNLLPDGSFIIPNLPTGRYLADITVPGFPTVSSQIQVRAGFVSSTTIQLPPGRPPEDSVGIGVIPDMESFSDDLAAHVHSALQEQAGDRPVELLIGPIGVWEEFRQLAPLAEGLDIIDRDNRFTSDLERLKVIGNSLGLRYIVLTHMDISREFSRRGNPFLNLAIRYFVPQLPVNIPDFTPNELRSRGVMIVVDLQEDNPGDLAGYYEAFGKDQVGGDRIFEDAAAGLFRRQAEKMAPDLLEQWEEEGAPFS